MNAINLLRAMNARAKHVFPVLSRMDSIRKKLDLKQFNKDWELAAYGASHFPDDNKPSYERQSYRPKHSDLLCSIFFDMKSSLFPSEEEIIKANKLSRKNQLENVITRLDQIEPTINQNTEILDKNNGSLFSRGIYQIRLLEKETCLKLIEDIAIIRHCFPIYPWRPGNLLLNFTLFY
jgi:hypothetical protein